jgi:hypothetical protein
MDPVARAEAHEGERRLADHDGRRRGAELHRHHAQQVREQVAEHHPRAITTEGTRRFDEGGVAEHARLREREARERCPRGQEEDRAEMGARRRADRREHHQREEERRERLHEIARTRYAALEASARQARHRAKWTADDEAH